MGILEAQKQLEASQREANRLSAALATIRTQDELTRVYETRLTEAATLLACLKDKIAAIKAGPAQARRELVGLLAMGGRVDTEIGGTRKRVGVFMSYAFADPRAVTERGPRELGIDTEDLWHAQPGDVRAAFPAAVESLLHRVAGRELNGDRLVRLRGIADTVFDTRRSDDQPSAVELTRLRRAALR